jgi:hypothetical protein
MQPLRKWSTKQGWMEIGCREICPPAVYPSCWDGRSRGQIKHGWWMVFPTTYFLSILISFSWILKYLFSLVPFSSRYWDLSVNALFRLWKQGIKALILIFKPRQLLLHWDNYMNVIWDGRSHYRVCNTFQLKYCKRTKFDALLFLVPLVQRILGAKIGFQNMLKFNLR